MVGGNERIISTAETNHIKKLRNVKSLSIIEMSKRTGFCLELKGNMQMRNTYLKKTLVNFHPVSLQKRNGMEIHQRHILYNHIFPKFFCGGNLTLNRYRNTNS